MVRMNNVWLKLVKCRMKKPRHRHRDRKVTSIEVLHSRNTNYVALVAREMSKLRGDDKYSVTKNAVLVRELLDTTSNPAYVRSKRIRDHDNVHVAPLERCRADDFHQCGQVP